MTSRVVYLGTGPNADAARYLTAHSDLSTVVRINRDAWWKGANGHTRVELTVHSWVDPDWTEARRQLWTTVEALGYGDDVTIDLRASGHLDEHNREVLIEALRIALLDQVDIDYPEAIA